MGERICYIKGEYVPESEARISICDWGLVEGGVYELTRTFNHVPFKLREHIHRFFRSLRSVPFIKFRLTPEEVQDITGEVLKRNEICLDPKDDWAIVFRATRGVQFNPSAGPTFYIHTVPLPYGTTHAQLAKWYTQGAPLVVASTRQIPPHCLDPKIKHTNRLGYNMAEYEAKMVDPEAFTLMLDTNGCAAEGARENLLMVKDGRLFTPRLTGALEGVTRGTILELAEELNIESNVADLTVADLYNADEMMVTNTSVCIIPVSKFNNQPLRKPIPGPVTRQLISAFTNLVNFDFVERALKASST
jgi:branched-chain amino acid aminotransferase